MLHHSHELHKGEHRTTSESLPNFCLIIQAITGMLMLDSTALSLEIYHESGKFDGKKQFCSCSFPLELL